jgi:hypothetical protein
MFFSLDACRPVSRAGSATRDRSLAGCAERRCGGCSRGKSEKSPRTLDQRRRRRLLAPKKPVV